MWSTITAAVQSGWASTGRLLAVLGLLGVLAIGLAIAAGESDMTFVLRALFTRDY